MRKLGFNKMLDCLSLPLISLNSCNSCMSNYTIDEEEGLNERKGLLKSHWDQMIDLRDAFGGPKPLSLHLEPKTVELRVSMHCNGCARKIEKHISKIEGVSSIQVDLPSKKVVVTGDISPMEVMESISKVTKFAELWVNTPKTGDLKSIF
ncbi:hypothetical protein LUZ60_008506 [Juncus effusus]|nr:hypothetical protein LUZ60_008506 [Juncus effusus]